MAYLPVKARSEFVTPTNSAGGGVADTRVRFQIASPASSSPGESPTRGSVGSWTSVSALGAVFSGSVAEDGVLRAGSAAADVVPDEAHAVMPSSPAVPATSHRERRCAAICRGPVRE